MSDTPRHIPLGLDIALYRRGMASPMRRKRGTPTVGVQVDIEPDVKALIDQYATAAGVPQWAIIEAAIRAGEPGPNGIPVGWELPDHPRLDLHHGGGEQVLHTA